MSWDIDNTITINDNVDRVCEYCDNITFIYDRDHIIICEICYQKWNPLKKLEIIFKKLGDNK